MPYYLILKGATATPELTLADRAYPSRELAFKASDPKAQTVVFHPSYDELSQWRDREQTRCNDGTYTRVPWYQSAPASCLHHFCHVSTDQPGKVAFTKNAEYGFLDRQTRMTPGRYLETYFKGHYTDAHKGWIETMAVYATTTFQIAATSEEIVRVYQGGPESCMSHDDEHYQGHCHPCLVYGEPYDLRLAYIGEIDRASQRALCWPEKKLFGRIYGTGPLKLLLEAAGYAAAEDYRMEGARIKRIENCNDDGGLIMPYVDGWDAIFDAGTHLVLKTGNVRADETCGVATRFYLTCEQCGGICDADDLEDDVCNRCRDRSTICDRCERRCYGDDGTQMVGNQDWCESCLDYSAYNCDVCGENFVWRGTFTDAERRQRAGQERSYFCRSCWTDAVENDDTDATDNATEEPSLSNEPVPAPHAPNMLGPGCTLAHDQNRTRYPDDLRTALRTGVWTVAGEFAECQFYFCRKRIEPGQMFLLAFGEIGYCQSCLGSYLHDRDVVPPMPRETEFI